MITVVSAFEDHPAAEAASKRLLAAGFAPADVQLTKLGSAVGNAGTLEVDEFATGGFIENFSHLLDGLFDIAPAGRNVATYTDLVRHEGSLLAARTGSPEAAAEAREILAAAGARMVSTLPQPGLE